jgi:transposase
MKLYGGIDLHSNNSVVALSDERDQVVYRRRLPHDPEVILTALAPYSEALVGVVESTYNWYWLVDALMEAGYLVHLANTAAIVQYSGLKYSDDDSDAAWLSKLLRLTPPTAAASAASGSPTASPRAKATPRAATRIWPGPTWKRPTSRCATTPR